MSSPDQHLPHYCPPKLIKLWKNPQFHCHQTVRFVGGTGKIKSVQQQAICWAYHVEMSMGVEPDFGRVGAETTIVLEEQELYPIEQMGSIISPVNPYSLEHKYYNRDEAGSYSHYLEEKALNANGRG